MILLFGRALSQRLEQTLIVRLVPDLTGIFIRPLQALLDDLGDIPGLADPAAGIDADVIRRAINDQCGDFLTASDDQKHLSLPGRSAYTQKTPEVENRHEISTQIHQPRKPRARIRQIVTTRKLDEFHRQGKIMHEAARADPKPVALNPHSAIRRLRQAELLIWRNKIARQRYGWTE